MLDIQFIRDNPDIVKAAAKNKKVDVDIDALLAMDVERRQLIGAIEKRRAEHKVVSDQIMKEKDAKAKQQAIEAMREQKKEEKEQEDTLQKIEDEFQTLLLRVPNVPSEDTPVGKDESQNKILRQVGTPPKFSFEPKDHATLGETLGFIDSEVAAKVSGARFAYLKGELVTLQQALYTFVFSLLTDKKALAQIIKKNKLSVPATPFVPVIPPLMIRPEIFEKMARLEPKEERYYIPSDDVYLIGSAEHTLGPLHMQETLNEADLPLRYVAYTPAFRREAGTYGKDMRGILRLHQFDKVEMESFCLPENSRAEQNFFVAVEEHILQSLDIPYQVVQICTGDMGAPDARQIDIECWMPGQNRYRETNTADLMTDYQARRLQIKVRRTNGVTEYVHMNDATVVAGRCLIAIMENYQEADGSIRIPKILQPLMNKKKYIGQHEK